MKKSIFQKARHHPDPKLDNVPGDIVTLVPNRSSKAALADKRRHR